MRTRVSVIVILGAILAFLAGFAVVKSQQRPVSEGKLARSETARATAKNSAPAPPELNLRMILADPTQSCDPVALASKYAFGEAVILVSYQTAGNIEACGCSPVELGGMAARGGLIAEVRKRQPVLTLDLGAITDGTDSFNLLKARYILKAMELAGYDAMGLGVAELALEPTKLRELLQETDTGYFAANVYAKRGSWEPPTDVGKRYQKWELLPSIAASDLPSLAQATAGTLVPVAPGGFKWIVQAHQIGIVFLNFTGLSETQLELPGYRMVSPREWLQAWSEQGNWELADTWVLAAEGYSAQIAEVTKDYPQFQLILTGDSHFSGRSEEDMLKPVQTESGATWLNTCNLGGYLGLVNITFGPRGKDQASLVAYNLPIASILSPDRKILEMVKSEYHGALASVFREQSFKHRAAVIIQPEECRQCHQRAYDVFKKSAHSRSLDSLQSAGQKYNVECLSCHVVYDYTEDKMYPLQCASCHPGADYRHIAEARAGVKPTREDEASLTYEFCGRCHTPRRSMRFRRHFKEYAASVRH